MVPNGQVEFVLRQPLALEGQAMVASSGLPVFGGVVTVTQASGVRTALTDREGRYRIAGLANEFALVEIDHRLYRPQLAGLSEPLHARAGTVLRRDFRLEPGLSLAGEVRLPWDISDPSSFQDGGRDREGRAARPEPRRARRRAGVPPAFPTAFRSSPCGRMVTTSCGATSAPPCAGCAPSRCARTCPPSISIFEVSGS